MHVPLRFSAVIVCLMLLAHFAARAETPAEVDYQRGSAMQKAGNYDGAIAAYGECLQKDPQYVNAYKDRALCFFIKGNLAAALGDANHVIELRPEEAMGYSNRGGI